MHAVQSIPRELVKNRITEQIAGVPRQTRFKASVLQCRLPVRQLDSVSLPCFSHFPCVSVRVVSNPSLRHLSAGEPGDVWVRGVESLT